MSEIQRRDQDPSYHLSQVLREAQKYAQGPPQVRGSTQQRESHAKLPDGTTIDVYERTTKWEVTW